VIDDQPVDISTPARTIVAMPYTVEINDVPMMAVSQHASEEWLKRGIRQFDRLYEESTAQRRPAGARVMAISVHPFLSGVPHRIGYVEELFEYVLSKPGVVCWSGDRILDWYLKARSK
jgi:hypothetical protein